MRGRLSVSGDYRKGPKEFKSGVIGMTDYILDEFGSINNFAAYMRELGQMEYQFREAKEQKQKWQAILRYYQFMKEEIDEAPLTQWATDPYGLGIADSYTPIERDAWCCIRLHGYVMYPQYPAHGYFLDFAHPKAKVAVEMDGKKWHDPERDAKRDARLRENGWLVFRIKGAECYARHTHPDDLAEKYEDNLECAEYRRAMRDWYTKTVEGVIVSVGEAYLTGEGYMSHPHADFIDESLCLHLSGGGW